jgi:hypothetical protein
LSVAFAAALAGLVMVYVASVLQPATVLRACHRLRCSGMRDIRRCKALRLADSEFLSPAD